MNRTSFGATPAAHLTLAVALVWSLASCAAPESEGNAPDSTGEEDSAPGSEDLGGLEIEAEPERGFGDGTYVVGEDVAPGTYRSSEPGLCYWARLGGFSQELGDIIANGNVGPEIVTVADGDVGFETNGCGRWLPVDETAEGAPATNFSDGTFKLGVHIAPGRYRAGGGSDDLCYWARLSNFSHELDGVIANGLAPGIVEIAPSDAGFTSSGCGTWEQV